MLTKYRSGLILNILKEEYRKRIDVITNMISHTEKLTSDHIITVNENNRYMRSLSDITKNLNLMYWNTTKTLKGEENEIIQDDKHEILITKKNIDKLFDKIKNIDLNLQDVYLQSILTTNYLEDTEDIFNFKEIDRSIRDLTIVIGAKDILDILFLYTKYPSSFLFIDDTSKQLLEILQKRFIPVYVVQNNKSDYTSPSISICDSSNQIPLKYEILLDNFYKVKINAYSNLDIDVFGFFDIDPINSAVTMSDVYEVLINEKRKKLNSITTKNKIPVEFKQLYVKSLPVGKLLSYDEKMYTAVLNSDYTLFLKYSNQSFKQMLDDFLQASLCDKFKKIKMLLFAQEYSSLLSVDKSINTNFESNAKLLFEAIKEIKTNNLISEVILRNLDLSSRQKIAKMDSFIKHEIERLSNLDMDDLDLKKQTALNPCIPDKIKKIIFNKLSEMKSGNTEYHKQLLYVKTLIEFPWINNNDSDIFTMYTSDNEKKRETITSIKSKLNEKVYGHTECKETIVELMAKWFSNPKGMGKAIGLCGPPGVGKTLIAKKLGDALDIPFCQINLGGMEDGSVLSGHSITYSGAVPGLIVKKMVEAGKPRCIIFFDELDKTAYHHGKNEIYDTLMHVIDSTSNSEFTDKFFQEVKFPLNKVLFMFSFNDRDKIDKILLDRMEIINIGSYSSDDKVSIINDFLISDLKDDFGFNDYNVSIQKEDSLYLVNSFTMEAGVREIKRKLEKIFSGLNMDRLMGTGIFHKDDKKNIIITKELIEKYINKPKLTVKKINDVPKIGNVNGLYATSMGTGGIIPILVYKNYTNVTDKKFRLKLTGKQGIVMKESVHFAFTIACNLIKRNYLNDFFENYPNGLHIHTPDGSTSKDGPSAGAAFTLAFVSVILGKRIKNDIGLTGEIDQDGTITAIGGLENKLAGAKAGGIRLVFVPHENEKDIKKIKSTHLDLFDDNFRCILVNNIFDILDMTLIEDTDNSENNPTFDKLFDHMQYTCKNK
jgi:endopeptidase La